MSDENRSTIIAPTFLSRYYLNNEELYSDTRYLTIIMRTSIFERIFVRYIFKSATRHVSLLEFLTSLQAKPKELEIFKSRLKTIIQNFSTEGPLYIYGKIAEEILNLLKEDINNIKIDKFLLKLEFFFAWHFENNFYEKQSDQRLYMSFDDTMYLQTGRTNFYYSIESIHTIFKFLKIFEKQTLTTRFPEFLEANNSLFCSEKVYYFYCDKLNKDKIPSGNIVEYMLKQLFKKFDNLKNSKVNNVQIENYIMITLYCINKIIQDYSFYFYKRPELESIFDLVKTLKSWPVPISNLCNDVMETIINESSFQGISVLNKLREKYFIDFISPNVNEIKIEPFSSTVMLFSEDWDKRHYDTINSENPKAFNIIRLLERFKKKPKKKISMKLNLRELLMKLFITILFNSNQSFSNSTLQKVYDLFYPDFLENAVNPEETKEVLNNDEEMEEEESEINTEELGNTKKNLDQILKILDVGFDKTIEDFNKEINIIATKLINQEGGEINTEENQYDLLSNEYLLPITSMRYYLKPQYNDIQKISNNYYEKSHFLDLITIYNQNFQFIVRNYFPHLLETSEDPVTQKNTEHLRQQLYQNFRLNVVLIEEGKVFNDFIRNMTECYYTILDEKISDDDFTNFWSYFVPNKRDIRVHYLLFVVPHFDDYKLNPFKLISKDDTLDNVQSLLSEFIALNDTLYKNIVYMPWASKCDSTFFSYIPNCQTRNEKKIMEFPALDTMYGFLKKPLDYYLTDSNGIFKLNLYQLQCNDAKSQNLSNYTFWKNLVITVQEPSTTKITCQCVDFLGLEYNEEKKVEIVLKEPFQIRLYNLFFKKNVPFNYNMSSNNGWLEMFVNDRYNKNEVNTYCNYQTFLEVGNQGRFYEEFNVPQMDLKTMFKNYKVTNLKISTNSKNPIVIADDYEEIDIGVKGDSKSNNMINLNIGEFIRDGEKMTIPIATFTSF